MTNIDVLLSQVDRSFQFDCAFETDRVPCIGEKIVYSFEGVSKIHEVVDVHFSKDKAPQVFVIRRETTQDYLSSLGAPKY